MSPGGELERLLAWRPLSEIEPGLERVRALLRRRNDPHRAFRSVHVVGTNGKGSTAAILESVLRAEGRRTGLYTSPELFRLEERFRVDGRPLPREELEARAAELGPLVQETGATFFEAGTALAFDAFRAASVEVAVVEAGMGGRFDATNVLDPDLCAVTSVGLDHQEWLGRDVVSVAREKAGALKEGVPTAMGPVDDAVRGLFERTADRVGAPLLELGKVGRVGGVRVAPGRTTFRYRSPVRGPLDLELPLAGRHQARNAGVALLALDARSEPPDDEAVRRGLASVRWRGRGEWVEGEEGGWLLDVAHNPAAAASLAELVRDLSPAAPVVLLAAVLRDKDAEGLLSVLEEVCGRSVLTVAPSTTRERRWEPGPVASRRQGVREAVADFGEALDRARELAGRGTVVVAGSTAVVADALRALRPEDAGAPAPNVHRHRVRSHPTREGARMRYDPKLVQPMREELTKLGVEELRTADEVDEALGDADDSVMVVVNSVCGCAAQNARPAVAKALEHETTPRRSYTVFAGQDAEATERARTYFTGYRPSSPSIALLRDGEIVFMLERHQIEGRSAEAIADDLTDAFDRYCAAVA